MWEKEKMLEASIFSLSHLTFETFVLLLHSWQPMSRIFFVPERHSSIADLTYRYSCVDWDQNQELYIKSYVVGTH